MRLEAAQQAMLAAIDHGPAFMPPGLFRGLPEAALRGLAVHANTVSHARLVALEETFPQTREAMGHGEFNRLSRLFVETAEARCEPLATIGREFAAFLGGTAPGHAPLALREWAWLECYHAADAPAAALADLAAVGEDGLLDLVATRHPAARLVPGGAGEGATLFTRPDAEVLETPLTPRAARLFALLENCSQTICNLFDVPGEPGDEDNLPAVLALLEAGSLVLTQS